MCCNRHASQSWLSAPNCPLHQWKVKLLGTNNYTPFQCVEGSVYPMATKCLVMTALRLGFDNHSTSLPTSVALNCFTIYPSHDLFVCLIYTRASHLIHACVLFIPMEKTTELKCSSCHTWISIVPYVYVYCSFNNVASHFMLSC